MRRRQLLYTLAVSAAGVGLLSDSTIGEPDAEQSRGEQITIFDSDDSPSPQPQNHKDHYIVFSIDSNDSNPSYEVSVPDPDPALVNIETHSRLDGSDDVYYHNDYTTVQGQLDSSAKPYEDEIEFNGSLSSSDFDWEADGTVTVEVDSDTKQRG